METVGRTDRKGKKAEKEKKEKAEKEKTDKKKDKKGTKKEDKKEDPDKKKKEEEVKPLTFDLENRFEEALAAYDAIPAK